MTDPTPLELTEADVPAGVAGEEVPALWRKEVPAKLPGEAPAATPRRRVFLWLLGFLLICSVLVGVVSWVRPAPKPYFAPIWVTEYQYRPFHSPPFGIQDREALTGGNFFAKGRIQLKALGNSLPADTVVMYLSAYAVCDENGQVMMVPVDAEPGSPLSFRPLSTVLKVLRGAPAQKKFLVLDLCWPLEDAYWGRLDAGVAARIAQELKNDPDLFVLCPCAPGQIPLAAPELGRSAFAYFLEEGLRGWADYEQINPERQGLVTVKKLAAYVQTKVEQWAKLHQNAVQTPILYGQADDFPLVALGKGKPLTRSERAAPEKYPDWLIGAWKTRDVWWAQERYRSAPWLFRQAEAAVINADRGWQNGGDAALLKKELSDELERLEKYYRRIALSAKPEPLSLAQHFQADKTLDAKWVASVKELFRKVTEERAAAKPADAEKAVRKVIEEFADKAKQVSDADWAGGIVEVLCTDPFPRRDTLRLGERLLSLRNANAKFAESDAVRRLAKLAESPDETAWPVGLVRKALSLMQKGEQAAARPQTFPWFAAALESAAQKRHDAETLLFAQGYVAPASAEAPLAAALRDCEFLVAKQNLLEDALQLMQQAAALLPGYGNFLDEFPSADPAWHEALRMTLELQALLKPPAEKGGLPIAQLNPLIEEVRTRAENLQGSLRQLRQAHAPEVLEDLLARSQRPDADVVTYRELLAQWALPFHAGETRAKIWDARSALGGRLADKILATDTEIVEASARPEAEVAQDMQKARRLSSARSKRSLELLRLAGLDAAQLDKLEKEWSELANVRAVDLDKTAEKVRDGYVLSFALRQAWAQTLVEQTANEKDPAALERASRVVPGWMRLGAKEESLAKAALVSLHAREHALWGWLGDRYRYASREPEASPFVARAAFALREYASKEAYAFSLPVGTTIAELTPQKPAQVVPIALRWQALPKTDAHASLILFDPNEDWLQIDPDLAPLERLKTLPATEAGSLDLPLRIALKPQAELGASPRPAGILLGVKFAGRTYHHKIALPTLPNADRLEILVSADPKKPDVPLGDLRLRPSKERQSFYVYVQNLSEKPRAVIVELRANDRIVPGGTVSLTAAPKQATRVMFAPVGPVAKDAAASPAASGLPEPAAKKSDELPELLAPLQIRMLDKDRPQDVLTTREIGVDLAQPREYVRVPSIRFEPPSADGKIKNRLEVAVQAARKLSGPPCLVELVIPKERIPGLKVVRTGTFRGELPADGGAIKLTAGEFEFEEIGNESGMVYLTVDGIERAFLFRTTFAPVGEPTNPREELRPALRLRTGKYYRTNTKYEAAVEVDNAPGAARLQVSLGQWNANTFQTEISRPLLLPKQKRIGFGLRSSDGGIEFDTLLRDWRVPFEAVPVRGERVVQARLLDKEGKDLLLPVYETVFFDDRSPERVDFVNLPRQAKRDLPFLLKATGLDAGTGLGEVAFFMALPGEDGKYPVGVAKFEAMQSVKEPDVWSALVRWPAERKGPFDLSVRFTNKLGLSTFAKGTVELVDFDPLKSKTGTIEGTVRHGARLQTGIVVALSDAKGNKLAEQKTKEGGTFAFTDVPPGAYVVSASKSTSGRPLTATSKVNLAPGKTERVNLELFL